MKNLATLFPNSFEKYVHSPDGEVYPYIPSCLPADKPQKIVFIESDALPGFGAMSDFANHIKSLETLCLNDAPVKYIHEADLLHIMGEIYESSICVASQIVIPFLAKGCLKKIVVKVSDIKLRFAGPSLTSERYLDISQSTKHCAFVMVL